MTSLRRETITNDVWVTKPISETAIHEAFDVFRSQYIDKPNQLVMHPEARNSLLVQLDKTAIHHGSYIGMDFVIDYGLEDNEWCVRLSISKTYAIESKS